MEHYLTSWKIRKAQNSQGIKAIQYGSNTQCESENIWFEAEKKSRRRIMKNPGCHI